MTNRILTDNKGNYAEMDTEHANAWIREIISAHISARIEQSSFRTTQLLKKDQIDQQKKMRWITTTLKVVFAWVTAIPVVGPYAKVLIPRLNNAYGWYELGRCKWGGDMKKGQGLALMGDNDNYNSHMSPLSTGNDPDLAGYALNGNMGAFNKCQRTRLENAEQITAKTLLSGITGVEYQPMEALRIINNYQATQNTTQTLILFHEMCKSDISELLLFAYSAADGIKFDNVSGNVDRKTLVHVTNGNNALNYVSPDIITKRWKHSPPLGDTVGEGLTTKYFTDSESMFGTIYNTYEFTSEHGLEIGEFYERRYTNVDWEKDIIIAIMATKIFYFAYFGNYTRYSNISTYTNDWLVKEMSKLRVPYKDFVDNKTGFLATANVPSRLAYATKYWKEIRDTIFPNLWKMPNTNEELLKLIWLVQDSALFMTAMMSTDWTTPDHKFDGWYSWLVSFILRDPVVQTYLITHKVDRERFITPSGSLVGTLGLASPTRTSGKSMGDTWRYQWQGQNQAVGKLPRNLFRLTNTTYDTFLASFLESTSMSIKTVTPQQRTNLTPRKDPITDMLESASKISCDHTKRILNYLLKQNK